MCALLIWKNKVILLGTTPSVLAWVTELLPKQIMALLVVEVQARLKSVLLLVRVEL